MRLSALLLTVAILLAGCGSRQSGALKVDPALLMLVPGDTQTLAGVKLDQLRAAPVYKKYGEKLESRWLPAFQARTGLDPRKAVWELVGALRQDQPLLLARGKFVADGGMEPRLEALGAERFQYRGYTLIGSEQAAVTFLNPSTVAAGRAQSLRDVLDRRGQAQGPSRELTAALRRIGGDSQLWIASIAGPADAAGKAEGHPHILQMGRFLGSIRGYYGGVSLRNGLDLQGHLDCDSPAGAESLVRTLKGFVGMGRLNVPDNQPELLRFFDGVKVEQKDRAVEIAIQADEASFERAVEFLSSHSGTGGGLTSVLPDLLR